MIHFQHIAPVADDHLFLKCIQENMKDNLGKTEFIGLGMQLDDRSVFLLIAILGKLYFESLFPTF